MSPHLPDRLHARRQDVALWRHRSRNDRRRGVSALKDERPGAGNRLTPDVSGRSVTDRIRVAVDCGSLQAFGGHEPVPLGQQSG